MASSDKQHHILLLTGTPGIGKTTLIRKVASQLYQYHMGGFFTEEIREGGQRKGFRLVTFNGEAGIIAHINFDHHYSVSKYGVDVSVIDHFAETTLAIVDEIDVYLIDEIGKMECFSKKFTSLISRLLESKRLLIATVAMRGGGLIAEIKKRDDIQLVEVNRENQDKILEQVLKLLN